MPKRLVFVEVDQEGKSVLWPEVADAMYCEDGGCEWCTAAKRNVADALSSLPSASEALVEEIAKRLYNDRRDMLGKLSGLSPWEVIADTPTGEGWRDEARDLIARVEGTP
jgi:hypothetical protein